MPSALRANLWLLVLTVGLCCIAYPLVLLAAAQLPPLRHQAEGGLLLDARGKPVGSRLIAQPFSAREYFWPRPSAVSYTANASGGSNYGANNYLLRDRVARALGPIVKYESGQEVGPDIETWFQKDRFQKKPGIVAQWAEAHSTLAQNWVKADDLNRAFVAAWLGGHPETVKQWVEKNPETPNPKPEDMAVEFFKSFSEDFPGQWPTIDTPPGEKEKKIVLADKGEDIQKIFFDMWLQDRQDDPDAQPLKPVPADMVMASGSGLDPHITLKNAEYQLDRVAREWAEKTKRDPGTVRGEIEKLLNEHAQAPFNGLFGVPLVNVLEVNLALRDRYAPIR